MSAGSSESLFGDRRWLTQLRIDAASAIRDPADIHEFFDKLADLVDRHQRLLASARKVADLSQEERSTYGRNVTRDEFAAALFELECAVRMPGERP